MAENRSNTPRQDEPLQFKDLLIIYISKWKWFVLSLAVCLGIAAIYLLKTPPVYTRTASLLRLGDEFLGPRTLPEQYQREQ